MNVYQQVLVKLYEATGGRASKAVYLKDIVKDLGYLPSYSDIFQQMSHDGWITETSRSDEVNITPWGVRAAKKFESGKGVDSKEASKAAKRLLASVKDLVVMTEEFVDEANEENLSTVNKKVSEVAAKVKEMSDLL